ncbi:MAG: undecaprenyldiphospho-muramoylpentapeptide beta-N-acetylglucosaminyltransferase [Gammaproteobacteria bacterium]|nr:undecaprenyldiphospho-muramoylpentapeptide beta-N-acetylglucosaminyltransferase [Gammaproteobacteria bacterium]
MTVKLKKVLIMAGGTGGHVFPGLALAHYLAEQGVEVEWLGTPAGMEARIVPEAKIPFHSISITGVRGKGFRTLLQAPFKITMALWQAVKVIHRTKPDVVIGMGGFASGPGGLASWLMRRPLIIHEQNAKAGFTNQLLSRIAKKTLVGFPATLNIKNATTVGNPVRSDIENILPPEHRFKRIDKTLRLLVIGGSLGAQALNELIPQAINKLPQQDRPHVIHQTGPKQFDLAQKHYTKYAINADLRPFIQDMAEVYAWADLVICRAGALTISELCAVGLGAIFIPFPFAVDDHQTANANYMVQHQAALCVQQKAITPEKLAAMIMIFSQNPEKRLAMATAAHQLRQVNVPAKIFASINEAFDTVHKPLKEINT